MEEKPIIQERQAIESAPTIKPKRKIFWSGDKLIGISALLVSIASVSVILYQTHLMQKQQYASALPYLELWNNGSDIEYRLSLVNNGIGPAFVKEVRVIYKGKAYEGDQIRFLEEVIFPRDTSFSQSYYYSNLSVGRVIPAGKEVNLFHIKVDSGEAAIRYRRLLGNQDSARLEVVYSSVYDEKWKLTGVGGISEKIKE